MQKIAILGGGIGALATAAELTNEPGWEDKYEITIYQMGWRLGGKGASGRNQKVSDRIQEHGIHLWMGFYENAFQLIRNAYDEATAKNLMPQSPFTTARNAFSPMNYMPMMEQVGDDWRLWNLDWPPNGDFPGEESTFVERQNPPTPFEFAKLLLDRSLAFLDAKKDRFPILVQLYQDAAGHLCDAVAATQGLPSHRPLLDAALRPPLDLAAGAHTALHCITAFVKSLPADIGLHAPEVHLAVAESLKDFNAAVLKLIEGQLENDDELRRFFVILDTGLATVAGMIEDRVLQQGFMAIEEYDMIEWLTKHGCHSAVSPISLGMYDACFGYKDGDPKQRSMGAGSTLYGSLRLMFTYRGALMWWMNAGMGETVMSPLYLVLKSRGVKFQFFHKVTNLRLSADGRAIDSVELEVQATTGDREYDPLFLGVDGIPCWPTEPLWDQLAEAEQIQSCKNPDLESWWTDWKGEPAVLRRGADFDLVVLGISLGAHPYICRDLIAASARWQAMVGSVGVVRTQGLQLWINRTLAGLGWPNAPGVLSGFVEPFDTWSDMSHLIARERWPSMAGVQQISYFCNAMPSDAAPLPFDDPTYPETQRQRVIEFARSFLDGPLLSIFPAASSDPTHFNDDVLVKCTDDAAQSAFESQFFRANIDPTELYVLSLPGSAPKRLMSHDSDFDNLYLAGDWTLTDLNIGCIEAAVISARMASRAICGKPDHIYGAFGSLTPIVDTVPAGTK